MNYLNTGRAIPTFVPAAALRARRRRQADAGPERRDARAPGADRSPRRGVVSERREAGGSRVQPGHALRFGRRARRLRGAERPVAAKPRGARRRAARHRFGAFLVGGYAGIVVLGGTRPGSAARPRAAMRADGRKARRRGRRGPARHSVRRLRDRAGDRFLADASAGQCGPCAHGLASVAEALEEISDGVGRARDSPVDREMGRGRRRPGRLRAS